MFFFTTKWYTVVLGTDTVPEVRFSRTHACIQGRRGVGDFPVRFCPATGPIFFPRPLTNTGSSSPSFELGFRPKCLETPPPLRPSPIPFPPFRRTCPRPPLPSVTIPSPSRTPRVVRSYRRGLYHPLLPMVWLCDPLFSAILN